MASETRSIRLPKALADALELRSRNLQYSSFNAYVLGVLIYDLLVQGPHTLTGPLMDAPARQRDELYQKLLTLTEKGEGERGVLLERIIQRIHKQEQEINGQTLMLAILEEAGA